MSEVDISRMAGKVKVKWTENGKQYGFITTEKLYQAMFHKEHSEYTNVLKVKEFPAIDLGDWDSVPHPAEWDEFGIDPKQMNERLWEVDFQEEKPDGPVASGEEK